MRLTYAWELPAPALDVPERLEDALDQCAHGTSDPDTALLQLLVVSRSEEQAQEALGTAIWDLLESREPNKAERLGAVQHLWDGARRLVQSALR